MLASNDVADQERLTVGIVWLATSVSRRSQLMVFRVRCPRQTIPCAAIWLLVRVASIYL